jgi:hypothetical protein
MAAIATSARRSSPSVGVPSNGVALRGTVRMVWMVV